ncbi:precorrin-8X methylmutase, partial [Pseudomonas aeruginosa]|uniref:precorrin-8X methylmutase n=1 Tax=Pseudomonas aeruginosa TaxID=287 RepID=UPI001EE80AD4
MIDYIRDGQAIYRQSFATIRAEANLAGIPADLEKLAVRVIHACGMVDVVDDLRFSPGAGAAGRFAARFCVHAQLHIARGHADQEFDVGVIALLN